MTTIADPQTGPVAYDLAAREAQTIGEGPRYAPLTPEETSDEARQMIADIKKAFGIPENNPIPEVSLITLRHPGMFRGQMALGIELAGHGTIPGRERELAVLRVAILCGAPFEWAEHVDIGRKFGLTDEDIDRVLAGSSAQGWSEHEGAVVRAVEELIADKCLSDATWNILAKTWNEQQLIEMPMLVGSYMMTALQQNTLRIRPKGGFDYR
ncbi:MAG: carboxymuconolactone decarboxylase family protein [Sphingomonadaceae bacterium]|jgi:alkylhydroperoxidase family enzyme